MGGGLPWVHLHPSNCFCLSVCLFLSKCLFCAFCVSDGGKLEEGFVERADYCIKFSLGRLRTLYEVEWLSSDVNWPLEGSFDRGLVRNVWKIVTEDPRHPDQFPYIDQWLNLVQKPPPWLRRCALSLGARVLVVGTLKHTATESPRRPSLSVLQSPPEDSDLPPPYNPGQQRPNSTASPPLTQQETPMGLLLPLQAGTSRYYHPGHSPFARSTTPGTSHRQALYSLCAFLDW